MTQKEFAVRMGMSEKHISKLINGEVQLTIETARRLEMVLGLPAQFWCNLEIIYREKLLKVQDENSMDEDIIIAKKMPYGEMVVHGWIEHASRWSDRVVVLRKYFETVQLQFLKDTLLPRIACRTLSGREKSDLALLAWAQKAKIEARSIETKRIDVERLDSIVPSIKTLVSEPLKQNYAKLKEILAECGIALVLLPRMEASFLNGATFVDGDKVVVGLVEGETDSNHFGVDLFHELAHIIYGHIWKADGTSEEDESCADEFAKKTMSGV